MSTPDTQAAALTWRDKPLPSYGSRIRVRHTTSVSGRSHTSSDTVTVNTVSLTGDVLVINNVIRLDSSRLSDGWQQVLAPATGEQAIPTAPEVDVSTPASIPQRDGAPDPHPTDLAGMQRRWAWVRDQLTDTKAKVKALGEEKAKLDEMIIEACVDQGLNAPLPIDNRTWYFGGTKRMVYLVDDDGEKYTPEDVIKALRADGLETGIVREGYNHQSLEAFLREREEQGLDLPAALAAVIKLESRPDVRSVAGARAKVKGAIALREWSAQRDR